MPRTVILALSAVLAFAAASTATTRGELESGRSPRDRARGSRPARVIVQTGDAETVEHLIASLGGRTGRRLTSVPAVVAEVPADRLGVLAAHPAVRAVNDDRPIHGSLDR